MRSTEFITERLPTPDEMRVRGVDPNDKDDVAMSNSDRDISSAPGPVGFSAYDAIQNILGRGKVTFNDDNIPPGCVYLVYQTSTPPEFIAMDTQAEGGAIELNFDIHSNAAADIAIAVHEAFHAYMHAKVPGGLFTNEKMTNSLSIRWLKKYLSGYNLHIAIEVITGSRISYGDKMKDVKMGMI